MIAPVTLGEVARRAGVSLATASRVLNGSSRRVTEDLRDRVIRVAHQLGYVANAQAQAVARGSSSIVGLVIHDVADPYFSAIAAGVMDAADRRGLVVTLATTRRSTAREIAYVEMLRAQRVRALVLAGSRVTDRAVTDRLAQEVLAYRRSGGRVACVSQHRLPADTVLPENRSAAHELARELVGLGHRRFAILTGPRSVLTARDRVAGFRAGLTEAGVALPADSLVPGAFTRDGGYTAAAELAHRLGDVSCVFAVNDVMAVGAIAAFREAGVAIPGDVSVAGFDDIETLRDLVPPLSTVRLPLEWMGSKAVELALDLTPSEVGHERVVRVSGQVILRESTQRLAGPAA